MMAGVSAGLPSRLLSQPVEHCNVKRHREGSEAYPYLLPILHLIHVYFEQSLFICHIRPGIGGNESCVLQRLGLT